METLKIGVTAVESKKLLEDGIRKELVRQVAAVLDRIVQFPPAKNFTLEEFLAKL